MAILRMVPNAVHFREFQTDPVTGHYYHNTCGETALAAAMVAASAPIESTQDAINLMTSMTREMMGLHWADSPEGATTTAHLHDEAIRRGYSIAAHYTQWEDPIPATDLHPWLLQYAGVMPIVLMITNAGPGLTAIDGSHPERGVMGHFIAILGLADEGYVTMDGDNNVIKDHLVIYPWSSIQAAHVTGFLMLNMQGAQTVAVPASWKDANGIVTAPNGITVIRGNADFIRHNPWEEDDFPLEEEQNVKLVEPFSNPAIGAGVRQVFRKSMLGWSPTFNGGNVYKAWLGQEFLAQEKAYNDLKAAPAPTVDPNPALQAQIADLQAQLGAAQQQIAALQQTQVTPQQQVDIDAINKLRDALATHA